LRFNRDFPPGLFPRLYPPARPSLLLHMALSFLPHTANFPLSNFRVIPPPNPFQSSASNPPPTRDELSSFAKQKPSPSDSPRPLRTDPLPVEPAPPHLMGVPLFLLTHQFVFFFSLHLLDLSGPSPHPPISDTPLRTHIRSSNPTDLVSTSILPRPVGKNPEGAVLFFLRRNLLL